MTRDAIFEVVKANIRGVIEGSKDVEIVEDHTMHDFGADSLEIVEVVSRSMKALRLKIPRAELSKAEDLRGLLDLFEAAAAASGRV